MQILYALEVARIADVHCIRERGDGWVRRPLSGLEIIGQRAVPIRGQDNLADWESHRLRPEGRHRVAKIAGRDDVARWRATLSKVPETRRRVVNSLRQQAAKVDAVGRQQTASLGPFSICECSLDDALTIVENTTHGKGAHVVAPAGELLLLACGNLFLGKKNDHFHVAAFSESGSDSAAG